MKIVIDTNLIISAIYFGGKPKILTDLLDVEMYENIEIMTVAEFLRVNFPNE